MYLFLLRFKTVKIHSHVGRAVTLLVHYMLLAILSFNSKRGEQQLHNDHPSEAALGLNPIEHQRSDLPVSYIKTVREGP